MLKTVKETVDFAAALAQKDIPYIWGGNCPYCQKGVDCSGFIQFVLWYAGLDPKGDQSAQDLYNNFAARNWRSMRGPGAVIFYGRSRFAITHIALEGYNDTIIEAGGGDSNTTSPIPTARVRARPISNRKDIVAVIMPEYRKD